MARPASGYLRFFRHATLVEIAAEDDAVIGLRYRPGHFLTQGLPMASVWPPEAAATGRRTRSGAVHITGPMRTLTQDIAFGIDQLVEYRDPGPVPGRQRHVSPFTCIVLAR